MVPAVMVPSGCNNQVPKLCLCLRILLLGEGLLDSDHSQPGYNWLRKSSMPMTSTTPTHLVVRFTHVQIMEP